MFRSMVLIPVLFVLLATGIACSDSDSVLAPLEPVDVPDLETARELWATRGSESYSIHQERLCFCAGPRSWRADVESGKLVAVHADGPGGGVVELESARTVADVFDLVERAQSEAAEIQVEFDPVFGFAREVYVDWNLGIADDEIRWTMTDLVLAAPSP